MFCCACMHNVNYVIQGHRSGIPTWYMWFNIRTWLNAEKDGHVIYKK